MSDDLEDDAELIRTDASGDDLVDEDEDEGAVEERLDAMEDEDDLTVDEDQDEFADLQEAWDAGQFGRALTSVDDDRLADLRGLVPSCDRTGR